MQMPPEPPDERERLQALRQAHLLDTSPEQVFDDLTHVAALVCATPVALVSLVDARRQWFKSRVGLDTTETPRQVAFCAYAICGPDVLVVEDTHRDDRFRDNPLVTDAPGVRFYAGAPILTQDARAVGTVCVIDHVPRSLAPLQRSALEFLARQAAALIDLRRYAVSAERAKAELQDFLDGAFDLIQAVGPDGRIRYVNRSWVATLGYSEQEASSLDLFDIVAPESQAHCRSLFAAVLEGRAARDVRAVLLRKDGARIHVAGSTTTAIEDGAVLHTRSVFRDVTAHVEAERARDKFITKATAELRTPLAAIAGALDALESALGAPLSGATLELVELARAQTRRLARVLGDIDLLHCSPSRLAPSLQRTAVSLDAVAADALSRTAAAARARSTTVALEVAKRLEVDGDRERLGETLAHLVSNAVRNSPHGSTVLVTIDASAPATARVTVRDEGFGISTEDQPLIAHLFCGAPPRHRPTPSRAGLGLAVSHAIVAAHGGRTGFESDLGRGSSFWFELPLASLTQPTA